MNNLERLVGSALLLGTLTSSTSAQDEPKTSEAPKPKIVQSNDPSLLKATKYYMPYFDIKRNLTYSTLSTEKIGTSY